MKDIVERLRSCGNIGLAIEAAQEIERLREALEDIIIDCDWPDRVVKLARAALKEGE